MDNPRTMHEDLLLARICKAIYITEQDVRDREMASSGFAVNVDNIQSSSPCTNSSGFSYIIAWSEEARILSVVFRESADIEHLVTNEFYIPTAIEESNSRIKVHAGLILALNQTNTGEIFDNINIFVSNCHDVAQIIFCGHSLGGAYAVLVRTLWICNKDKLHKSRPSLRKIYRKVRVVTFGSPLIFSVEDGDAAESIHPELHEEARAYVNGADLIPRLFGNKAARGWSMLERDGLVSAVGEVAADRILALGASADALSYVHVGELRGLGGSGGEPCTPPRFGPDACLLLELPTGLGTEEMVLDGDAAAYVSGLARPSPLLTLEAALQHRETALRAFDDLLRVHGTAAGAAAGGGDDRTWIIVAVSQALARRYRGDWAVEQMGEQVLSSLGAGPSRTGNISSSGLPCCSADGPETPIDEPGPVGEGEEAAAAATADISVQKALSSRSSSPGPPLAQDAVEGDDGEQGRDAAADSSSWSHVEGLGPGLLVKDTRRAALKAAVCEALAEPRPGHRLASSAVARPVAAERPAKPLVSSVPKPGPPAAFPAAAAAPQAAAVVTAAVPGIEALEGCAQGGDHFDSSPNQAILQLSVSLGQDVSGMSGPSPASTDLQVGALVGVLRSSSAITAARVVPLEAGHEPGSVLLQLEEQNGPGRPMMKLVPASQVQKFLYSIMCPVQSMPQSPQAQQSPSTPLSPACSVGSLTARSRSQNSLSAVDLPVGTPVLVRRSDGSVSQGRVMSPEPDKTPPGGVLVMLHSSPGSAPLFKNVPPDMVPVLLSVLPKSEPGSVAAKAGLVLGQDVTGQALSLLGELEGHVLQGRLVGVPRSSGAVTVGRVMQPGPHTAPGLVRVLLSENGAMKDLAPSQLYEVPQLC